MNNRIYIHEIVDVIGHHKMKYVDHMCAYAPVSRTDRKMPMFGIWATVGSTTRWPTAVNLWEAQGWDGLAANFAFETGGAGGYDQRLLDWMAEAVKLRSSGFDRILVPAAYSPTSDEAVANADIVGAKVFCHEIVRTVPGEAPAYLDQVGEHFLPLARRAGLALTGAYRTAMADDSETVFIWAVRDWPLWGKAEQALDVDPAIRSWRNSVRGLAQKREWFVMISGAKSPLATGVPL